MTVWEKTFLAITLEKDESWVTVWLNRPDVKNALSENMTLELTKALNFIANDKMIRGVAIRGVNGCFCSGADLKEFERNYLEYLNAKHRDTLDTIKSGKLTDDVIDVLTNAAKEISAQYA